MKRQNQLIKSRIQLMSSGIRISIILIRSHRTMIGIPMKNENSVAIERLVPTNNPPRIVEPERLVPGTKC